MTRYNIFKSFLIWQEENCQMTKINETMYNRFMPSGKLAETHSDYGVGFYDVSIYVIKPDQEWLLRVWFGTIDDGDFGAWASCKSRESALALLEKVVQTFSVMDECPSENALNEEFKSLGVWFGKE